MLSNLGGFPFCREELLEDYRDYLRTHNLPLWEKEDPRALQIRQLAKQKNRTYETYESYLSEDANFLKGRGF